MVNTEANRCGLFVIDVARKKVVVLRRRCPYTSDGKKRINYHDGQQHQPFVEQFCVPRGICLNSYEQPFTCGVREFIEECGFFFKRFYRAAKTFILKWQDPKDVFWEYTISFIFADLSTMFVPIDTKIGELVAHITAETKGIEEGSIKLEESVLENVVNTRASTNFNLNHIFVPIWTEALIRLRCRENVQAVVMNLDKYLELINLQKPFYTSSNYDQFLEFIQYQIRKHSKNVALL